MPTAELAIQFQRIQGTGSWSVMNK